MKSNGGVMKWLLAEVDYRDRKIVASLQVLQLSALTRMVIQKNKCKKAKDKYKIHKDKYKIHSKE